MEDLQRKIFAALEAKDVSQANNDMLQLCSMLQEDLTAQSIDAYINLFFTKGASVTTYLDKIFKLNISNINEVQSIQSCLGVVYMLLNNFPKEMADHVSSIKNMCEVILNGEQYKMFRHKCAEIVWLLVSSKDIDLDEPAVMSIYAQVKRWLSDTSTKTLQIHIQILGALSGNKWLTSKLEEIANNIINFIKKIHSYRNGVQNLLQGGYHAAHGFMTHAQFSSEQHLLLYDYMKRDACFKEDYGRRQGSRFVVEFTALNAETFSAQIQNDVRDWTTILQAWFIQYQSKDDTKAGYEALVSVYRAVGNAWAFSESLPMEFLPMLQNAKDILEKNNNDNETKLAIYTIGFLAPTAAKFMAAKDFRDLFLFLLQRIEYLIFVKVDANANVLTANSCDYVEAISPFLKTLQTDIQLHINQFKRVTIILIKMFPNILMKKHEIVIKTLRSMFTSIALSKDAVFHDFVKDVVKQGVIWTCSHNLAQEVEILNNDGISYKKYLPLWLGLLYNEEKAELGETQKELWNQLIKNLLYMSDKLNLKVTIKELENADHLQAEKSNDFVIFANIAEFYCDLLNSANAYHLKPWFDTFSDHLIRKSMQLPLVSGFYKLMATTMRLFEHVDNFNQTRVDRWDHVRVTFENVKNYFKHVLKQVHRFKNDLQLSCVLLILRMPLAVVTSIHYDYSGVFVTAFKLGQHNFPLANVALDTLSEWYRRMPEDVSLPLLKQVVPCLDAFLRNQFVVGDSFHVEGRKLKKYGQRKLDVEVEPELVQLQHKVLRFLALVPNEICLELNSTSGELKLTKGYSKLLKVILPFGERSLSLSLDPFLDRVLVLSVESTDRKIRITACELLHSIVAIFLGTSAQMNTNESDVQLEKILTVMLQLASHQDTTVVSLFNPLLLQMAHWYSHKKHSTSSHAQIFIKTLMDGVTNENDGAVRDLSGNVLREYVAWTRKQTSITELKQNMNNVKLIIDHMKQFCLHPDEAKRYGATVIFNNIYRELREEDSFVDAFWLEILYAFVMNLSLVAPATSDDNLLNEINLCLDRVTRCFLQKQALFTRAACERSTPPKFNGNTFDDAALFILQHTWQINTHCRTKCMEMFKKLPSEALIKALGHFDMNCYMHDLHTTLFLDNVGTIEEVLRYFASLTCFIDGHIFITELSPSVDHSDSVLWSVLNKLIERDFKKMNLKEIYNNLSSRNDVLVRRIKDEFVYFRSKLVEKMLTLYEVLLSGEAHDHNGNVTNENAWNFLSDYLFDYRALGLLDLPHKKWEERASKLLKLFLDATKVNSPALQMFGLACGLAISKVEELEDQLNSQSDVAWPHRQILRVLMVLRRVDAKNTLEIPQIVNLSPVEALYAVLGLDKMEDDNIPAIPKLKDSQCEYFTLKLEMMLDDASNPNYSADFDNLLKSLCCERSIYSTEWKTTQPQGVFVFLFFKKTILKHTLQENRVFKTLGTIAHESSVNLRVKYFKEYLKHVYNTPHLKGNHKIQEELMKSVEYIWPRIKAGLETIKDSVCLELIYDLRLIVDVLSGGIMLETVAAILNKMQPTDVQQVHHLTQVVRVLGMVAPRGLSSEMADILGTMRARNIAYFQAETKRITTTLFIKTMFDATNYSFSLNFFISALDLYIVLKNDFEVDVAFCRDFMAKLPKELQGALINEIFAMGPDYTFKQNVVLTLCLCNLMAYCDYEVFEEFYVQHIAYILEAFSLPSVLGKTLSSIMLNRLFGNINIENFNNRSCKITRAACTTVNSGRELISRVAGILFDVVKDVVNLGDDPEEFRLYQCYAYNALATLVCNTRLTKPEFYLKLFIRQDSNEEDILWTKLVPQHKSYGFEMIADDIPKKKKVLSDIRTQIAADVLPQEYIESQNLFLSTLSEDITNYDFTNVCVRHEGVKAADAPRRKDAMALEIDDEDINKHECMLQICGVIKHMYDNSMLLPETPPQWVGDIGSMLLKEKSSNNIRQFLCKVIENSQQVLKQYAKILTPGIIRTIYATCTDLNGLAADCVVMLLTTWNEHLPTANDTTLLLEFLMRNLWNDRSEVFTYNVSLLKTAVETYQTFQLSEGFIDSMFKQNVNDKSNMAVIHVINIMLVNNVSPFPRTLQTFTKKLCSLLGAEEQKIYKATAETLGLALKFLEDNNHGSLTPFKNKITKELQDILKRFSARFVSVLEGAVRNYPDICTPFLSTIERLLEYRNCTEISKTAYLKIYLKCIDGVCETGLINKLPLSDWVTSSSLNILIVTLEIILQGVQFFDSCKAESLVERVVKLANNTPVCRSIRIDILIAFYKRFNNQSDDRSKLIVKMLKEPLISGFVDVEEEIRKKVYAFWTDEDMLPSNLEKKLLYLLENLYDDSNEELYLTFCNFLMLHDLRDDGQPIFNVPLHQCEFRDYEVNSHWRTQNATMMPMFTASAQSEKFYLRATQSYEFEQTQKMLSTQRQSYTQSASVLTFGTMPQSTRADNELFLNPNNFDISTHKVKKWRFFKNKADVSKNHALRQIHKGQNIEKQKHDAKKMKEEQVKIYRKYRTGDFPDIQIGVRAITDPLKELSKNDGQIAQLLYKSLFDSIVDVATRGDLLDQGCTAIQTIFTSSAMFDPVCIGAFLQIALEHKHIMRFPPDLIKTVAMKSGNLSYGCLLLEEYLISREGEETAGNSLHWIRLADLYKKMEEWDVVQGIFVNKMTCPDDLLMEIKRAIKAESENYWDDSRKHYFQLIRKDNDINRKDFYYEAYFKCSEELSDWQEIEKRCEQTTESNPSTVFGALWSSEWNKEILLPHYIKSKVRIGAKFGHHDIADFETILREAMKDDNKKGHLRKEFSDEVALLYLDKLRIKLARNYAENHATRFLKMWKFTKPSYASMQNKMLLAMKNCSEITVLLTMYDRITDSTYEEVIGEIATMWTKSSAKDSAIPTQFLTTRITLRESFINLTKLKLQTLPLDTQEDDRMASKLSQLSFGAEVNVIQQAVKHKNLHLAKFYAKKTCSRTDVTAANQAVSWLLYSKVSALRRFYLPAFKGHYKCVTQPTLNEQPSLAIEAALHLTDLCKAVVSASEEQEIALDPFRPFVTSCALNRFSDLLKYAFENLRDTLHNLDQQENANGEQLADAFLHLGNEYAARGDGYENRFIECSLKSMQYGSEKARSVFPKLLAVNGLQAIHKAQFIQQTSCIPTYMFISWIPQLLAYCDTDKVSVVKHLVENLAREYPNSIIYAYKLSKEKFTYAFEETRPLTHKLDELLHNKLVDKMLSALKHVAVPSTIIRTALSKLKKACKESQEVFIQTGQQVAALFDIAEDPSIRGECYEHVLKCKDQLMSIINYSPFDEDAIIKKLSEFVLTNPKHSSDLGRYSPWLNYFHASDHEQEIEVPGCYTGTCRPLPHYHPKISKFSTDVTVFHSLYKPIRITIYANDVKEYRFLVKYGEDLRQDQRIQQLFKLMNVVLSSDVKCRERKLKVSTFEVIPLSGELGFIQWVDETEILKKVITNRSGYPNIEQKMRKLQDTHAKIGLNHNMAEIKDNYLKLVSGLPWDALRKSLWNITPDAETFFALRMTFIRSYAVMCVANWLLGIGDRHLENILLNMNTGSVVGIDFGHAFGSATQQQLLPELVPFRLTPQLLNVMMPLKENGLLHQAMVHALRVLRENCDILLSTMDIFIVEPTLNWLTFNDDRWNAAIIMELARAKFQGKNSISIMIEEVKSRRNDTPEMNQTYVECLENLLGSIELTDEDDILSVQGQVKCLIAHATDSNLLGRMFYGWEPWI